MATYEIEPGIFVYEKFTHPLEQPYIKAIKEAYPDGELLDGPWIPGKLGCFSYTILINGEKMIVNVREDNYQIDSLVKR